MVYTKLWYCVTSAEKSEFFITLLPAPSLFPLSCTPYTIIDDLFIRMTSNFQKNFLSCPGRPHSLKLSASPSQKFSPCPGGAEFLKLQLYQTKGFVPCPGRENILKPNASSFLIYRTSEVPAKGAAQAAPLTPPGPSFSCWKKRKQKTIQGDYCPLENPLLGSALAASPFHPHGRKPLR